MLLVHLKLESKWTQGREVAQTQLSANVISISVDLECVNITKMNCHSYDRSTRIFLGAEMLIKLKNHLSYLVLQLISAMFVWAGLGLAGPNELCRKKLYSRTSIIIYEIMSL